MSDAQYCSDRGHLSPNLKASWILRTPAYVQLLASALCCYSGYCPRPLIVKCARRTDCCAYTASPVLTQPAVVRHAERLTCCVHDGLHTLSCSWEESVDRRSIRSQVTGASIPLTKEKREQHKAASLGHLRHFVQV